MNSGSGNGLPSTNNNIREARRKDDHQRKSCEDNSNLTISSIAASTSNQVQNVVGWGLASITSWYKQLTELPSLESEKEWLEREKKWIEDKIFDLKFEKTSLESRKFSVEFSVEFSLRMDMDSKERRKAFKLDTESDRQMESDLRTGEIENLDKQIKKVDWQIQAAEAKMDQINSRIRYLDRKMDILEGIHDDGGVEYSQHILNSKDD